MKTLRPLLLTLLSLAVPFWLILTAIRLLFTPAFLNVEYRLPGFPADPYGFTLQDRLHYGSLSLEYLVNDSDLTFLEEITLADGAPCVEIADHPVACAHRAPTPDTASPAPRPPNSTISEPVQTAATSLRPTNDSAPPPASAPPSAPSQAGAAIGSHASLDGSKSAPSSRYPDAPRPPQMNHRSAATTETKSLRGAMGASGNGSHRGPFSHTPDGPHSHAPVHHRMRTRPGSQPVASAW